PRLRLATRVVGDVWVRPQGRGAQVLAPEPGTGDRPRDASRAGSCTSRPREATPERWRSRAGPGASHHRDDDVSRDGHAVLAGAGGGGAEAVRMSRCPRLTLR